VAPFRAFTIEEKFSCKGKESYKFHWQSYLIQLGDVLSLLYNPISAVRYATAISINELQG